jgi:nitrite reductase/ring-hydroxylating ferredoxin subunit
MSDMKLDSSMTPACHAASACADAVASRREFLEETLCLTGLLVMLGVPTGATPVFIEGAVRGEERTYPVPAADGVSVDRDAQVILTRAGGRVYAFALSCPHQNAAVRWVAKEDRFQCTKHDSRYQVDGLHLSGRATRNMDRYPISREGNLIRVDISHVFQSDRDPGGWAAAGVTV